MARANNLKEEMKKQRKYMKKLREARAVVAAKEYLDEERA